MYTEENVIRLRNCLYVPMEINLKIDSYVLCLFDKMEVFVKYCNPVCQDVGEAGDRSLHAVIAGGFAL